MPSFTIKQTVAASFEQAEQRVRDELAAVGFGILTEIDMAATLRTKLGVEIPPQKILGACNPHFAHEATQADPSIAALLPCSVVVRSVDDVTTVIEGFDPAALATLAADNAQVAALAADVRALLSDALTKAAA